MLLIKTNSVIYIRYTNRENQCKEVRCKRKEASIIPSKNNANIEHLGKSQLIRLKLDLCDDVELAEWNHPSINRDT